MNRKMILTVSALLVAGSALSGCYDDRPGYAYRPYHDRGGYDGYRNGYRDHGGWRDRDGNWHEGDRRDDRGY